MRAESHQVLGAATGVTIGHVAGWPLLQVVAAGALGMLTSGGPVSPDCDQYDWWKRWCRPAWLAFGWLVTVAVPSWRAERGRHGDPTQHRGLTHWWGVPAVWAVALLVTQVAAPSPSWWPWWALWMLLAGWASHLLGDAVHGRTFWGQDGHGVPLAPWWRHVGLEVPGRMPKGGPWWRRSGWGWVVLKSSGRAETWGTVPVLVVVTAWQVAVVATVL